MTTKLKFLVASLALVGLSATALAKGGDHGPRKARLLAKFDANGNGVLDAGEKARLIEAKKAKKTAMRQQKRTAMLAKFDVNQDGSLDAAEKTAMRDQRLAKRFAKLDANRDGAITLDEMKAGSKSKGKGKRHRRVIQ